MDHVEQNVESLAMEIATLAARIDAATHRLLACIRRFDETGGWYEQGALSCAQWLTWRLGWDFGTAREKVRVARALGTLPAIDEALKSARLSYAKVRALTRVATPQTEAKLLEMALLATGAQLEVLCRGYRGARDRENGRLEPLREERQVHHWLLDGGMVKIEMILEADEADMVLRAIERAREVRAEEMRAESERRASTEQPESPESPESPEAGTEAEQADVSAETSWPTRADGVVRIAESYLAGKPVSGTGGERYQVVVHLEQEALGADGDWAATLEDGTRVSAETFRRVACDCGLLAAGGDGQPLNIGRRSRSIPPALRRALKLRDSGCAFPGCTHRSFLHAHHVVHWLHGGETSLENTLLLCTFHHHLVHEGGWTVGAAAAGGHDFHAPDGRLLSAERPVVEAEGGDWLRPYVDPELQVTGPAWDGKPVDYNEAVDYLLRA